LSLLLLKNRGVLEHSMKIWPDLTWTDLIWSAALPYFSCLHHVSFCRLAVLLSCCLVAWQFPIDWPTSTFQWFAHKDTLYFFFNSISSDMLRATCTVGPNGKSCDGSSGDTGVSGVVHFTQEGDGPVTVSYRVTGLTEGVWRSLLVICGAIVTPLSLRRMWWRLSGIVVNPSLSCFL
jgi:hypothetical protein